MSDFIKRVVLVVLLFTATFSFSQVEDTNKFNENYNTWSIGAGFSILNLHGDLRSFDTKSGDAYFNLGGYLYVDKMFNPVLGVEGRINISQLSGESQTLSNSSFSETSYYRVLYAQAYPDRILQIEGMSFGIESSLIIDIDNLWKRNSQKWNWAGYLGMGYQKYNSRLIIKDFNRDDEVYDPDDTQDKYHPNKVRDDGTINDADYGKNSNRDFTHNAGSLYLNAAIGLKYRLNNKFDIEARGVLNVNNEDHLDAAISHKQTYESFFTGNIGVVYKFGKKEKYAIWVQDEVIEPFVLVDSDDDGVQDGLDKEDDTPAGAEVYGSGIAVDSDKDGLKDYEDNCPLVPGPIDNKGCPLVAPVVYEEQPIAEEVVVEPVVEFNEEEKSNIMEKIALLSKSIYFKTNSDQLKQESYKPLNEIADVMNEYPDSRFKIEGHTDSRGNDNYNLNLSKKRSKSVYTYLTNKNIDSDRLSSKGYGEVQPIATNETEAGRQQNRRVEINFIDPDSEEGKLVYPQGTVLRRSSNNGISSGYSVGSSSPAIDSDGDGVPDFYDKEPNTPKESRVYGDGVSVDSDMDGVPDYRDDCPFAKGPEERNGCPVNLTGNANSNPTTNVVVSNGPDSDGDGVEDKFDKEPNTPVGVKVYANGVAFDSDKDGVPDHLDRCPLTYGNVNNNGCPEDEDLDGDGVVDREDRCPDEKGDASNFGCPIKKATGDIEAELKGLAKRFKFSRSEGHILKSNNVSVCEKIGFLLNQYKGTSIRIEVHTNNKPNLKYNFDLSKRRAFAIKKYLTNISGVESSRVEVEGLGGTEPKYDVDIKEENAKNNRVEIIIK